METGILLIPNAGASKVKEILIFSFVIYISHSFLLK